MPVAYQGVNRFSNAVALLVSWRVLVLRQIANALTDTRSVMTSRLCARNRGVGVSRKTCPMRVCRYLSSNARTGKIIVDCPDAYRYY
jgi:hypothetical protein